MDPNVLHNISYGMYIVSSHRDGAFNGQVVNTAFQITSEPVTIAISINKGNLTHEFISQSNIFSISVLTEEAPLNFIGKFGFRSGRTEDKFKDVKYKKLASGCPVVIEHAVCYLEAKVAGRLDCGTHTLFLGQMAGAEIIKVGKPMTYDYYHQIKRGTTPSSAPTFIKAESPGSKTLPLEKYRCKICNYIYDPTIGDPDGGIAPGTPFEKIPDSWVCPICGAAKSEFVVEAVC